MSIGDRIREIRKERSLTQTDFGEKIGFKQTAIGQFENGTRTVSDRTIILICNAYGVSEEWLRDGIGEMFVQDDNFLLSSLSQQYGLDNLDRKIIETYIRLPDIQRSAIKGFVRGLVDNILADENYEEYRADYIKEKAAPIAARHGDIGGLTDAANLYDESGETTKE